MNKCCSQKNCQKGSNLAKWVVSFLVNKRKSVIRTRKRTENSKQKFFASVFAKQKSAYLVVYCLCLQQTVSIPRYKTPWILSFNVVTVTVLVIVSKYKKKISIFLFLHAEILVCANPKLSFRFHSRARLYFLWNSQHFSVAKMSYFDRLIGACMCDGFNVYVSTHNVYTPRRKSIANHHI